LQHTVGLTLFPGRRRQRVFLDWLEFFVCVFVVVLDSLCLHCLLSFVCFSCGLWGTEKGWAQAFVRGAGRERAGRAGGRGVAGGRENPWRNGSEGRKSLRSDLKPAPEDA